LKASRVHRPNGAAATAAGSRLYGTATVPDEKEEAMKRIYPTLRAALGIALGVTACVIQAQTQQQTMPAMPGMTMPPQQTQPRQTPDAPQPNRTKLSAVPIPGDLTHMQQDSGDRRAKAAAASIQNSIEQQRNQGDKKPGADSDASSVKVPFQTVQEPEAIEFRTGTDLPAAELLRDVVSRPPMKVEDFIGLAEKSNPTLVEAQRNIDRSNAQARQAGLPSDPIVGYAGDHIRGGEYSGGEQGAFFSQVFVLGHKLALRLQRKLVCTSLREIYVAAQRARIRDDVGRGFFHTLAMQESVVIHDRLLKVALDTETNAHELERVGEADAADVLTAEIAAEQAKADFNQAQRMFLASFARLATDAGQHNLTAHPLQGGLVAPPEFDAEAMVGRDVQDSPYVKTAESHAAPKAG
jgi:cobalt-zinc-cadmium efflux system outer membrane protein